VLPQATTKRLGGVVVGTGLAVALGVISVAASGVAAGTYGSQSTVGAFTVGIDGRLTNASSVSIQISTSQVTGLDVALAGKQPLDADLTAISALSGSGYLNRSSDGSWTLVASTYTLPAATTTTLGGVIVGTGLSVSSGTISLDSVGTAGTYGMVTTDTYGRVSSGAAVCAVAYGGTGKNSWTQYGLLYASATTTLASLGVGTSGYVLVSGGSSAAPSWSALSGLCVTAIAATTPIVASASVGSVTLTHATSGVTAGSYGSASVVPVITLTAYGHVSAVTATSISITYSQVSNLSSWTGSSAITTVGTLSALTVSGTTTLSGFTTAGLVKTTSSGVLSVDSSTYLTANQTITLSGHVTGSGTTAITCTLAASGVAAGTYGSSTYIPVFTVDSYGRVTSVTNTALSLSSYISGTANKLSKFGSTGYTVVDSTITDTGSLVTVANALTITGAVSCSSTLAVSGVATFNAKIVGNYTGASNHIELTDSISTDYSMALYSLNSALDGSTYRYNLIGLGYANSAYNRCYLGFKLASTGSAVDNAISFGFHSRNDVVMIYASGAVAMNNALSNNGVQINNTLANSTCYALNIINSSLTSGYRENIVIGYDNSGYDAGVIGFYFGGSGAYSSNSLRLGTVNSPDVLQVYYNGVIVSGLTEYAGAQYQNNSCFLYGYIAGGGSAYSMLGMSSSDVITIGDASINAAINGSALTISAPTTISGYLYATKSVTKAVQLTNTLATDDYLHMTWAMASGRTATYPRALHSIGVDSSNYGYFGYKYSGSGSTSNALTMGHTGKNDVILVYKSGIVDFSTNLRVLGIQSFASAATSVAFDTTYNTYYLASGAIGSSFAVTFTNYTAGTEAHLYFKQYTTAIAITLTSVSGAVFIFTHTGTSVSSGSAIAASNFTASYYYHMRFHWVTSTTCFVTIE